MKISNKNSFTQIILIQSFTQQIAEEENLEVDSKFRALVAIGSHGFI